MAIIKNRSARLTDKTRKELHKIFEQFGLKITAESNLHVVNFLDVTFDPFTGKYKPYRKPNDDPLYIHKHSNHPPSILRQLPAPCGNFQHLSTSAFQRCHLTNKYLTMYIYIYIRKKTHANKYLAFTSNHPLQHKRSVVNTFLDRADKIPSTNRGKRKKRKHVINVLKDIYDKSCENKR